MTRARIMIKQNIYIRSKLIDEITNKIINDENREYVGVLFGPEKEKELSKYVFLANSSSFFQDSFKVSFKDYATKIGPILNKGFSVKTIFHNHLSSKDTPSDLDVLQMEESNLPWLIFYKDKNSIQYKMYQISDGKISTLKVKLI
jgi:proteasome lid subunit RPN8/RPN11